MANRSIHFFNGHCGTSRRWLASASSPQSVTAHCRLSRPTLTQLSTLSKSSLSQLSLLLLYFRRRCASATGWCLRRQRHPPHGAFLRNTIKTAMLYIGNLWTFSCKHLHALFNWQSTSAKIRNCNLLDESEILVIFQLRFQIKVGSSAGEDLIL